MKLKKNLKVISIILLVSALLIIGVFFVVQQSGIGSFSTRAACEVQRNSWLSEPFYVYCTSCETKYSDWGAIGYYSAGCFGSGSLGEACLASGGTCVDVDCRDCDDPTRICHETLTAVSNDDNGIIYEVEHWDDVCDKNVFKIECDDGYYLSGREYDSDFGDLGVCLIGGPVCDWSSDCIESVRCSDGTRKTRDTDGQLCGNGYCRSGVCLSESELCEGIDEFDCDGTTKLYGLSVVVNSDSGLPECKYINAEVNSADCGYEPPDCSVSVDCDDDTSCTVDKCSDDGVCEYDDSSCDIPPGPGPEPPVKNYLLWIIGGVALICIIAAIIIYAIDKKKKGKR